MNIIIILGCTVAYVGVASSVEFTDEATLVVTICQNSVFHLSISISKHIRQHVYACILLCVRLVHKAYFTITLHLPYST